MCVAGSRAMPPRAVGTPGGIRIARDYAASIGANGLVSVKNEVSSWLARNRSVFEPECRLLMPPAEVLDRLASKRRQLELAAKVGFDALPTAIVEKSSDCRRVPDAMFPVVLRPDRRRMGIPSFKVKTARSRHELHAIADAWGRVCGPMVAQPLARMPNLVVHGTRMETGNIPAMAPFLVPRKFEGVTLTIKPGGFPPGVEQCCRDFVEQAGITGCFHFELLFSPRRNRAWFLEINVRLGGTTDKVAALGYDESLHLLQAYGIIHAGAKHGVLKRGIAASRRALLKHAVWAARGRLTDIDYPAASRLGGIFRSAVDFCRARDSALDPHDLPGSLWRRGRIDGHA